MSPVNSSTTAAVSNWSRQTAVWVPSGVVQPRAAMWRRPASVHFCASSARSSFSSYRVRKSFVGSQPSDAGQGLVGGPVAGRGEDELPSIGVVGAGLVRIGEGAGAARRQRGLGERGVVPAAVRLRRQARDVRAGRVPDGVCRAGGEGGEGEEGGGPAEGGAEGPVGPSCVPSRADHADVVAGLERAYRFGWLRRGLLGELRLCRLLGLCRRLGHTDFIPHPPNLKRACQIRAYR
jgi:hypothetical protein